MEVEKKYLSVEECATILGCSQMTVRRLVYGGKLKSVNIGVSSRRIHRISIEEFERFVEETATDK